MEEKTGYQTSTTSTKIFTPAWDQHNAPDRIVTFGGYYAVAPLMESQAALQYIVRERPSSYDAQSVALLRDNVAWTKWINDLNRGRKWVQKRLFERFDPMLESDIALAVVPPHDPFQEAPGIRSLAQLLATGGRSNATGCLVRHTKIRRIAFGGPSTRALHRQTITLSQAHLVEDKNVLLLDDITKSGASLGACREMLYQAGARRVQAVALGRVIASNSSL